MYVKVGATRVGHDVKLAVAAGADVVVVDGMQGGTAATQDVFIEHAGIPTLPAVRQAAEALAEAGVAGEVQLVVSGGIRSGADVAKALALGADAVSIGVAALLALGCNRSSYTGLDGRTASTCRATTRRSARRPATVRTATPVAARSGSPRRIPSSNAGWAPRRPPTAVANFLRATTMEVTALARACGKSDVHHLEPEDLVALTVEAAAMARVPLAGTDWIPGWPR